MKLVIAGGGTGGHLFPGIAVAEAVVDQDPGSEILFVGTQLGIEALAVPKAGFSVRFIQVGGLKGKDWRVRWKTITQLPLAVMQARKILQDFGAHVVLGVGGYASGPVMLAAKLLNLPTAICEQNSVPGMTNRILGRVVDRICTNFQAAHAYFPAHKIVSTGNPVRRAFRQRAALVRGVHEAGVVFIFGGSQGAQFLNKIAPRSLSLLQERGIKVKALHQCGKGAEQDVSALYRAVGVEAEVYPFIEDMVSFYQRSAVVICRAGATSCAELTALGIPAVLVPFPHATDDHQTRNAEELLRAGACKMVPQNQLTPESLADELLPLLSNDEIRNAMSEHSRRIGKLQAADMVARLCFDISRNKEIRNHNDLQPGAAP